MKKTSKILQIVFLSGILSFSMSFSAQAFLPIPPMPWSIEVDIPGNAGKIVSNIKAAYRQYMTLKSEVNSFRLDNIKNGLLDELSGKLLAYDSAKGGKKGQKTPGKQEIAANSTLGITNGETDEEKLYNAYYRLFLMYPAAPSDDYKYQVVHTAYKHKTNEYIQDTLVDTYLIGRLTEDYLALVEKTLDRLDKCQRGEDISMEDCVFWGMKFVKVDSVESQDEITENNSGQLSAATNAYIVTTVYDRLMRIIEDLTAAEAIYHSAKQLEATEPYAPNQSSAEEYIPQKYHFAYNESKSYSHAKAIISSKLQSSCNPGEKGCAQYSNVKSSTSEIENAEVLTRLQTIEDYLNKALTAHNLITKMPEYKTEYRKYRKAEDVHKRTLQILKQSDACANDFIETYKVQGGDDDIFWSQYKNSKKTYEDTSTTLLNDYDNRIGISRDLITEYELKAQEKITGTNSVCDGYYQTCPSGYVLDKEGGNQCEENGEVYYPCKVKIIQRSDSNGNEVTDYPLTKYVDDTVNNPDIETDEDSGNYLEDSSDEDKLETENRKKAEQTWRIGYDKLMDLTLASTLKFEPWVDQKALQLQYIIKKYRNMEIIIQSIDKGINSFKVASRLAGNKTVTDPMESNIKSAVETIAQCESWTNAVALAKNEMGCSSSYVKCNDKSQKQQGKITIEKITKDSSGNEQKTTRSWTQLVGTQCDFKNNSAFSFESTSGTGTCATWDLTIDFLVKHYFSDELGGCKSDIESQARALDKTLKDKKRTVLQDKIASVVKNRAEYDEEIKNFVIEYQAKQDERQKKLNGVKKLIDDANKRIGVATNKKNILQQEYTRTKNYLDSLDDELIKVEADIENNKNNIEEKCTLNVKKWRITAEKDFLEKGSENAWICPCEEKLCKRIDSKQTKINLKIVNDVDESIKDQNTFIRTTIASKLIEEQNVIIKRQEKERKNSQKYASQIEEEIANAADEFADPTNKNSYIYKLNENQEKLEKLNAALENALKKKSKRMWKPGDEYEEDNLQTTLDEVLYSGMTGTLKNKIKKKIKSRWVGSLEGVLNSFPENFVLTKEIANMLNFSAGGYFKVSEITDKIIDEMADIAAEKANGYIKTADGYMQDEIDNAIDLIQKYREDIGVSENDPLPIGENFAENEKVKAIMNRENYGQDKDITNKHETLIAKLRKPVHEEVGDDRSTLFGIPSAQDLGTDDEYFVALPARGNNYPGIVSCVDDGNGNTSGDCNAGRDFRSPKEPLINLPPLREVFYYSAADYDNTPKSKKYGPAISYLLNLKFNQWETLPEIWRNILAQPNLRDDGKYQQTFVERSYSKADFETLLGKNDKNDKLYATKIARGGIYPCKLGNTIIDINGGKDNIKNIKFKKRKTLPDGLYQSEIPSCQEIASNQLPNLFGSNITSPCYLYNKKTNGICHLLADHGVKKVTDYEKNKNIKVTSDSMYNGYSELGNLLKINKKGHLVFRPLQEAVQKYVLNKKNSKNDLNRQKAETSAFKRNVFGSFLEVVVAENDAHKNLLNMRENIKSTLESLCKQIYDVPESIEITKNGVVEHSPIITGEEENCENKEGNDKEECIQKNVEACASYVAHQGGLAKTAEDKAYYENGDKDEKDYIGFDCTNNNNSYYSAFVCKLKVRRDKYIAIAEDAYKGLKGDKHYNDYKDIPEVSERMADIENSIEVFKGKNGDKEAVAYLTPGIKYSEVKEAVINAKADRRAVRKADEEGLKSMDNQTQIVPYCPLYTKTKKVK